jgi:hypothetical protein
MNKDVLAHKIYNKYCESVGGKAFNGDPLPKAEEFFNDPAKQKQADAWRESTKEIYELLLATTQNLGHPAYGLSSSTTIGIDELRERAFDFLEVPKR